MSNTNDPKDKKEHAIHPASLVPLKLVLEHIGAEPNQDKDKNKWKVHEKGNIAVKGQQWFDLNNQKGGWGASSLMAHVYDFTKKQAIEWLMQNFSDEIDMEQIVDAPTYVKEEKKPFNPPEPAPENNKYVRDYLVNVRQIPESIVDQQMAEGKIYADERRRCIFMAHNSAEVRGTTEYDEFKGCVDGSDTENSGYTVFSKDERIKKANVIAITEAAIDALSYFAFHPNIFCISSNGSGRFDLHNNIVNEAIKNKYKVIAAFDADWAGDSAAQKLFNAQYLKMYIAKQLNISEEQVYDWLIEKEKGFSINLELEDATNQIFFAKKSYDPETSIIRFSVSGDINPAFKEEKIYQVKVSEKGYNLITSFLRRDRPVLTKDWNEEWKARPKIKNTPR